ncbi:hypothetical protein COO60DRAFT_1291937 [Scenedesmus sp. NREL 46B-D3]|nr:hypothetical protein COO60DRAFT_1291937 [Scenedesmus sp. NREL 46B-D3]
MQYYTQGLPCKFNNHVICSSIALHKSACARQCSPTPWLVCIYQQQALQQISVKAAPSAQPEVPLLAAQEGGSYHVQAGISSSAATVSSAAVAQQAADDAIISSTSRSSGSLNSASGSDAVAEAAEAHAAAAQRLSGCLICQSSGRVPCKECDGRGFLKRGGYMKKNPLNMSRITGSKWTAMEETLGWRHFRVIQQRKLDKHTAFLLLQASCDHSAALWVNAQTLRDRGVWAAGWLPMSEIQGLGLEMQGRGLKCQACSGLGFKPCQSCDGTGKAQLIVL